METKKTNPEEGNWLDLSVTDLEELVEGTATPCMYGCQDDEDTPVLD